MYPSVQNSFIAFNEPLEARVHFMYLDVKSLVTTGIGNLLDADSAEHFGSNPHLQEYAYNLGWFLPPAGPVATRDEIDQEYQTVKFSGTASASLDVKKNITHLRLDDSAIDQLVINKLLEMEHALQGRPEFADLQSWPTDAQLGLFSMSWALGPVFHFPHFQTAAAAGDWKTMALESHMDTTGNSGIIPRNVRNELLFTIADWVAAPEPGDFTTLVFDPTQTLAANMRAGTFPIPVHLDIGVQTALERLGYDPNGLDGIFGAGTRSALTAFQRDQGLTETPNAKSGDEAGAATVDAIIAKLDELQIDYW